MTEDAMVKEQYTEAPELADISDISDLDRLLDSTFKPRTKEAAESVRSAVHTLAEQALADTGVISDDAIQTIESIIAAIDEKLTDQINEIIHHDTFRSLEGAWRGLNHLVSNTETDENLKLRVMDVSKQEVSKTLKKYKGANWDQSPLFKHLYEAEYGTAGGEPYGCLVGDFYFDHNPQDIAMLQGIARIAAAAHTPFIAGASPALTNMESWQELSNPRDLTNIFLSPEYAPWRSFRKSEDSKYVALAMPRFLSRLPYNPKDNPVDEFEFIEVTGNADHNKYVWSNSAYAMATNITRSFKEYGWCSRIRGAESGGMIAGLPCHTFSTDDGGVAMKCPTEIAITDRREAELAKNGLMPLVHWKNTDFAVFIGAQSVHDPGEYDDPDATANARLAARMPYLFSTCRFAHYLKCIVRDKIGSFAERKDMQTFLNKWIMQYVTTDATAGEETRAKYPLAAAEVIVEEDDTNPGYYKARFYLKPHYQLEGLSVSLRLVSKLPSVKS